MADEATAARLSKVERDSRPHASGNGAGATLAAPLSERLAGAVERATTYLLSLQTDGAYWVGELEADTTLESDYILFLKLLGRATPDRIRKLAHTVRSEQLSDGGWNIYAGGPSELNATIKAYVALKLAGDSPASPHMVRARMRALSLGGLESTNSFTRFYFALSGMIGWDNVPAMPPELILLPSWLFMNVYEMSSWTRGIVVPLTLLYALKPGWRLPATNGATSMGEDNRLDELFATSGRAISSFRWDPAIVTWRNFFLAANAVFRLYESLPWKPFRKVAIERASRWMLQHLERSEGLGAIYPAMVNGIMALVALGYLPDDPLTAREIRHLERFEIEDAQSLWLQPCLSPIWDTALAMAALDEAGVPGGHPDLVRAAAWLLENQVLGPGDWQVKNPQTPPGGWAFEYRNDFYPDVDDTAFVLMALQNVRFPSPERLSRTTQRGLNWVMSMQNRDGGWGAFDRDNTRSFLTRVPFADHNAMIDPSTPDLTARALECLGRYGLDASHPAVRRAVSYLKRAQTSEGAWEGRWGVNYVYGTSGVLRALETVGLQHEKFALRGADWLRSVQNPDGGFGESIASYDDPSRKGIGESTPSQTAWGLIGLLAAGSPSEPAILHATEFLLHRQKEDGSWDEDHWTGTGFPRVFYLKYHLYRICFPLYALARHNNLLRR